MSAAVSKTSTNVRTRHRASAPPLAVRAARTGFRVVGPLAPSLASSYAERLFLTARRHPRPAWEEEALASADERFTIPHDGKHLPAWRWGRGAATVLLVHGWEGRGSQMAAFVEPLVARGHSVVTFDVPGHGDAPAGVSSVVEHARAVLAAAAFLGPLHAVVAHSVGGAASLFATRLGFDPGRLALIAPPVSPGRFAAGFGAMMGLGPAVQAAMLARLERRYGVTMAELLVVPDAERFTRPLLVVHDEGDRVVEVEAGEAIAQAATAGRLVRTQGLGHSRILRAPAIVAEVVAFVAEGAQHGEAVASPLASVIEDDLFYRDRRW
jgi:alpha-beta hydrolase superfamily lysophospholipase